MSDRRVFSEQEAADLVIRAAKMQEASQESSSYTPGIDIEQLKRLAADVGVDEKFLFAAMSATPEAKDVHRRFMGLPIFDEYERVVEGELDPEDFDIVTDLMGSGPGRTRLSGNGNRTLMTTQVGRSLEGYVRSGPAYGPLKMTSRNGRTRISARRTMFVPFMAGLYPAIILSIVTMAMASENSISVAIAATIVLLLAIMGSVTFGALAMQGERKMKQIVDEMADRVADATSNQVRKNLAQSTSGQTSSLSVDEATTNLAND
jgi:hypothetical protein